MTDTALIDIPHLTPETATGEAADLLADAKARMGYLPNMYGYMAVLPAILAGYLSTYDSFRKTAGFTPAEQETVFLTVSRVNGCDYCMAAHSMIADKRSGVAPDALAALRAGTAVPDAKLEALATFTRIMVEKRGSPEKSEIAEFLAAGFTENHVLGVVLGIAVKTFSNYVNHLAGTEVDAAFAAYKVA
jgi:uncharacterized peroxidase-related enzyme